MAVVKVTCIPRRTHDLPLQNTFIIDVYSLWRGPGTSLYHTMRPRILSIIYERAGELRPNDAQRAGLGGTVPNRPNRTRTIAANPTISRPSQRGCSSLTHSHFPIGVRDCPALSHREGLSSIRGKVCLPQALTLPSGRGTVCHAPQGSPGPVVSPDRTSAHCYRFDVFCSTLDQRASVACGYSAQAQGKPTPGPNA